MEGGSRSAKLTWDRCGLGLQLCRRPILMDLASRDAGPVVIDVAVVARYGPRREHVSGALKRAASGAERAAHDRADGSAAAIALGCAGRLPGHRAGDGVP